MTVTRRPPTASQAAQSAWLTEQLTQFREVLTEDPGEPLEEIVVSPMLLLDDLCNHLGLAEADKQKVLGTQGVQAVNRLLTKLVFHIAEPEE